MINTGEAKHYLTGCHCAQVMTDLIIFELFNPLECLPRWCCLVASQYALPGYGDRRVWVNSRPRLARSLCQVIAGYALRLNSPPGTEGSMVSSLICDRWLILGLETLGISRCLNH